MLPESFELVFQIIDFFSSLYSNLWFQHGTVLDFRSIGNGPSPNQAWTGKTTGTGQGFPIGG
ncbi:MAG: hypothetical protein DMG12_03920 [Acidobacteria bacterium]|nr:MAG: hypothetical protein DMG12_03920 [Acidobacteriota bacterium]